MDIDRVIGGTDLFNIPDFIKIGLMSLAFMLMIRVLAQAYSEHQANKSNLTNSSNDSNIVEVS